MSNEDRGTGEGYQRRAGHKLLLGLLLILFIAVVGYTLGQWAGGH